MLYYVCNYFYSIKNFETLNFETLNLTPGRNKYKCAGIVIYMLITLRRVRRAKLLRHRAQEPHTTTTLDRRIKSSDLNDVTQRYS